VSRKKVTLIVFIIIAIVVVIGAKQLLRKRIAEVSDVSVAKKSYITTIVTQAKHEEIKDIRGFLATVMADKEISLSTKITGYITRIYVKESQKVKKNQPLLQIDESEIVSNIKSLNATLKMQKTDLATTKKIYLKNKKLYEVGGISKERLDLSLVALKVKEALVENTKQKIAQLQHQRTYLKIVAPFDGTIENILLHEGDLATLSKPIITMNNNIKKLTFSYAQNTNKIAKSQDVLYNNKKIGYIRTIYSSTKNTLTMAEVALTQPVDVPVGGNINIDVVLDRLSGCSIPLSAIVHKNGKEYVMSYENTKFVAKKVDILLSNKHKAIIQPCIKTKIAQGSETKLALLPIYTNVKITEATDEQ